MRCKSIAQIQLSKRDTLSTDRKQRLEAIGFVWDPLSAQWEAGFSALEAYKQAEGDCLVPAKLKTDDGFALGTWVANQRVRIEKLSADQKQRLDSIGFVCRIRGKPNP
jgi:hypothetical protein